MFHLIYSKLSFEHVINRKNILHSFFCTKSLSSGVYFVLAGHPSLAGHISVLNSHMWQVSPVQDSAVYRVLKTKEMGSAWGTPVYAIINSMSIHFLREGHKSSKNKQNVLDFWLEVYRNKENLERKVASYFSVWALPEKMRHFSCQYQCFRLKLWLNTSGFCHNSCITLYNLPSKHI